MNIRNKHYFKIISLAISAVFLFNSALYSSPILKDLLRVPVGQSFHRMRELLPADYTKVKQVQRYQNLGLKDPCFSAQLKDGRIVVTNQDNFLVITDLAKPGASVKLTNVKLNNVLDNPFGIIEREDGKIMVTNYGDSSLAIIDLAEPGASIKLTNSELNNVLNRPKGIIETKDGRIIATNWDNSLAIIDLTNRSASIKLTNDELNNILNNLRGIIETKDGKIIVANYGDSSIAIIYLAGPGASVKLTNGKLNNVLSNPFGIIERKDGKIMVTNYGDSSIAIIDLANPGASLKLTNNRLNNILGIPYGIIETKDGNIVVTDYGNESLAVIEFEDAQKNILQQFGMATSKAIESFPDVIPLQNIRTGEPFELRKIDGKKEYRLFIEGMEVAGSKFTFYETSSSIVIDDIFVQGHSNKSYKFTSQGIGLTILKYFYDYAGDKGKDLHIPHTRNYSLIRLCHYLSPKTYYFIDDRGKAKYFNEVDWLKDFGPIVISISDENRWIWDGKFLLEKGTEVMKHEIDPWIFPDKEGLADEIVVTNKDGKIDVRWKDPNKTDKIYFQVKLGKRIVRIVIPTGEIILPSEATRTGS